MQTQIVDFGLHFLSGYIAILLLSAVTKYIIIIYNNMQLENRDTRSKLFAFYIVDLKCINMYKVTSDTSNLNMISFISLVKFINW